MVVLGAILLATFLASFTDWLFMDVLVNRFYGANPALWRARGGGGRIALSQAIGTLTTASIILLSIYTHSQPFMVALAIWAGGALPINAQNLQWMQLHPAIAASHTAGWLARDLIAAACVALLLPHG